MISALLIYLLLTYLPKVPQLLENYREGSAEGISLAFLIVWFIGDLANFFGAVWAGLVPTVIALAVYFCFADAILITQCLYYNYVNQQKAARQAKLMSDGSGSDDPEQPLLRHGSDNIGLPGSRRRSSLSTKRRNSSLQSPLPSIPEIETSSRNWLKNVIFILLVCLAGCLGWVVAWKLGAWTPTSAEDNSSPRPALGAEMLGYLSAVAYLGYVIRDTSKLLGILLTPAAGTVQESPRLSKITGESFNLGPEYIS